MNKVEMAKALANKVEEFSYMRKLTPDEIQELRVELGEQSIKCRDLKIKLREANKKLKNQIKLIEAETEEILVDLKQKARMTTEDCYIEFDHSEKKTRYYSTSNGEMVYERAMLQDEMQYSIPMIEKKAV